jgi:mercuric ion binding protein
MKTYSLLFACMLSFTLFISCKNSAETAKKEISENVQEQAVLKKVTLGIEGMTCQIGCAKTIESKISKTAGVTSAKVLFEDNRGEFVFDTNQISAEEISEKISTIGNGSLYSVTEIKEIDLN